MRLRLLSSLALATVVGAACATPTEEHLIDASEALDQCDLRTAHEHFDAAYASDPSHAAAALGFALTDTVLLPEDPAVTAALADIGFTAPLDSELLLYGPDALLARLRRGEPCDSIGDFVRANIPYPPIRDSSVDGRALIRADLDAQQLVDRLTALDARFERLATAYETAASGMDGAREVTIDGSCGLGRTVVQAPELYAAAAAFVFVRAAIAIAPAYDWSMLVADLFSDDARVQADALASLLALRSAGQAEAGRPLMIRGLRLAQRAIEAASAIQTPVPDAAFDWTAMDRTVLADLGLMVERALSSFEARRPEAIPYMTPEVTIDLSAFLSTPPDSASLETPLWTAQESSWDPGYYWLQSNGESWEALLTPYFSANLWEGGIQWEIGDRWRDADLAAVFDPNDRYESGYMCSR